MNNEKNITVAFTGHRHYDGSADGQMYVLLEELYRQGFRCFLTGMAWGFDLAAAEQVIRLKLAYEDVRLVAVEPYEGFRRLFHGEDAARYDSIIAMAARRVCVGSGAGRESFYARNDYLVEHATYVVAWWNGRRGSGTGYTVKRALREGVRVENLFRNQLDLFSEL